MNNLKDTLKKYVHMTPQTFSYTMIGLSTAVLVFFIAYKDDDKPKSDELKVDDKSNSDESKVDESKSLPGEDEEQYDFDKNEDPMRMGDSRIGDSRIGDSRMGDSRMGDSRMGGSRSSRALDKSKHGKNTKTRKKGNKKHK